MPPGFSTLKTSPYTSSSCTDARYEQAFINFEVLTERHNTQTEARALQAEATDAHRVLLTGMSPAFLVNKVKMSFSEQLWIGHWLCNSALPC